MQDFAIKYYTITSLHFSGYTEVGPAREKSTNTGQALLKKFEGKMKKNAEYRTGNRKLTSNFTNIR